jgi:hypothetical protein
MGALKFLTAMGLFIGQSPAFFELMRDLAEDADEARHGLSVMGRGIKTLTPDLPHDGHDWTRQRIADWISTIGPTEQTSSEWRRPFTLRVRAILQGRLHRPNRASRTVQPKEAASECAASREYPFTSSANARRSNRRQRGGRRSWC